MNVKLDERSKKVAAIIGAAGAKYSSIAHAKKVALRKQWLLKCLYVVWLSMLSYNKLLEALPY